MALGICYANFTWILREDYILQIEIENVFPRYSI